MGGMGSMVGMVWHAGDVPSQAGCNGREHVWWEWALVCPVEWLMLWDVEEEGSAWDEEVRCEQGMWSMRGRAMWGMEHGGTVRAVMHGVDVPAPA